ncbi:MAG: ABC-type dipeptide/oligopeptide/nickel transport system ATPase component [Lysobacterales bacterium]|jgi:ABC-type dipeptide/oligopeptide/nickel transport system ATPase component
MPNPIITVQNLYVTVKGTGQEIVENVNFSVESESVTALVGGSGSGKTTTAMAILKLLSPALAVTTGQILYKGYNLTEFSESKMQEIRGKEVGVVFQEPLYAFNPVFTIGAQIQEVLRFHTRLTSIQREDKVLDLLDLVGLPNPKRVRDSYPHQLSGGMRQRAMIAQAIAADPQLIIADEPTSSLDVTLQAKIIELFQELKHKLKLSIILISHDMGMVKHLSDDVVVMQEGCVVEVGKTEDIIKKPNHDYTKKLVKAAGY